MPSRRSFLSSTVGSKLLVAVTGLSLVGFLVMHLIGNLLLYLGPDTFNHYSHKLISNPLVYPAEAGLVAIFVLHAWNTIRLTLASHHARPDAYAVKKRAGHTSRKTLASSTMIWSGLFLLVFIPIHIKTFKYGAYYEAAEPGVRDLSRLVVEIFSRPGWVAFYVVGMIVVGLHLWHGAASTLQTLGADTPRVTPVIRRVGLALAIILAVGFISIPLWIFLAGGRS
jgi:succinate dehydrogenase / fumarate reductase cytochrome b subunit